MMQSTLMLHGVLLQSANAPHAVSQRRCMLASLLLMLMFTGHLCTFVLATGLLGAVKSNSTKQPGVPGRGYVWGQ